jgi:hypothetical protein
LHTNPAVPALVYRHYSIFCLQLGCAQSLPYLMINGGAEFIPQAKIRQHQTE